ncbi:uncharacterized protein LOC135432761 isoform X1 [Drosophila montana]|uniref:uncharacterized protein LOC135432761 isoform X1 n=1 Tax=Drosophila montana TaxID=40370 RepID=UPI00313DF143
MRKFLIFVALCAVCTAAPAPADITETEVASARPIPAIIQELLKPTAKPIGPDAVQDESTKPKRESPEKPSSVTGHEAVQHDEHAHNQDAGKPDHAVLHEPGHHESTKPKRESPAKPAHEHNHDEPAVPEVHIPVTPLWHVPGEASSTRPSPLRHHPVPISEVLNKPKTTAEPSSSSSSSEESEEGKEIKT